MKRVKVDLAQVGVFPAGSLVSMSFLQQFHYIGIKSDELVQAPNLDTVMLISECLY